MPLVEWDEEQFKEQYRQPLNLTNKHGELICLNYVRFVQIPIHRRRAFRLAKALEMTGNESILFVGCGFGWLVECFIAQGHQGNLVGIDSGEYIQKQKNLTEETEIVKSLIDNKITVVETLWIECLTNFVDSGPKARVPVYDEDLLDQESCDRVLALNGNQKYDLVLTERVLTSLRDSEAKVLSRACRSVGNQVAHLVVPWLGRKYNPEQPEPNPWNRKWPQETNEPTAPQYMSLPWYTSTSWKKLLKPDLIIESTGYRVF